MWNPGLEGEVDTRENVQKFALRMCTEQWGSSYDKLLSSTNLPSLKERRTQASLCHLYKVIHGETEFADAPVQRQTLVTTLAFLSNMLFLCPSQELVHTNTHSFQQ